jgi:carbamoyl-phosphate synthase small subunit
MSRTVEASKVHAAGLIIKDLPLRRSNFRESASLTHTCEREGTVAIAGIDTRKLTRILRTQGAQNGCIVRFAAGHEITEADRRRRLPGARARRDMAGLDLAKVVSCAEALRMDADRMEARHGLRAAGQPRFHVVAYDFGVKFNILRMLAERGCRVTGRAGADPPPRCSRSSPTASSSRTARAIPSPATTRSRPRAR